MPNSKNRGQRRSIVYEQYTSFRRLLRYTSWSICWLLEFMDLKLISSGLLDLMKTVFQAEVIAIRLSAFQMLATGCQATIKILSNRLIRFKLVKEWVKYKQKKTKTEILSNVLMWVLRIMICLVDHFLWTFDSNFCDSSEIPNSTWKIKFQTPTIYLRIGGSNC